MNENIRILLIEDNPVDADLIEELLSESADPHFELVVARDLSEGQEILTGSGAGEKADAVLLDLTLPDSRGLETFTRAIASAPTVPFVVMTGLDDETVALNAVKEGAQDYLVKGSFDGGLLVRSILYAIERKRSEEDLRAEKEFTENILNSIKDVFYVFSVAEEGRAVRWNRAANEVTGYNDRELSSMTVFDFFRSEKERQLQEDFLERLMEEGQAGVDATIVTKDGRRIPFEFFSTLIRGPDGTPLYVCGVGRDITERKRSEEELRRINAELEGYAHTVSHDLKGPLSAVSLGGETLKMMLEGKDLEDARAQMEEISDNIVRGVRQAANLIDDLLALAEAGHEPEDVVDVDVTDTVGRILDERSMQLGEVRAEIITDDDLGHVTASPAHVYQLFSNLIDNAITHNDSEDPVVEVRYLGDREDGSHTYLVRDNGSGIPEEDERKIFLPFYKGQAGGTGIGLSTVQKIVKAYGGNIRTYNDGGACFEFNLKDKTGE